MEKRREIQLHPATDDGYCRICAAWKRDLYKGICAACRRSYGESRRKRVRDGPPPDALYVVEVKPDPPKP